jgi:hypothetical protein
MSFERAVQLFQEWGFRVEEGPGHEEVTLILEGPGHRSYYVYEVTRLPQIAAAALRVRSNNGTKKDSVLDAQQELSCDTEEPRGIVH